MTAGITPLKRGCRGALVSRYQAFLLGHGFYQGEVDGKFGKLSHDATVAFQENAALEAHGVVDDLTLGRSMLLGFRLLDGAEVPHRISRGPDWPVKPDDLRAPTDAWRKKHLGTFRFVHDPVEENPENVRILGGWATKNVVPVTIPALARIRGTPRGGRVWFHERGVEQLRALIHAWRVKGLLPLLRTWDGTYVARFQRGSRAKLSSHAWGSAVDINAAWNPMGARGPLVHDVGSVRELVPDAVSNGFFWGGWFERRPDPMHFELARLL
jgi:hypothetical protein